MIDLDILANLCIALREKKEIEIERDNRIYSTHIVEPTFGYDMVVRFQEKGVGYYSSQYFQTVQDMKETVEEHDRWLKCYLSQL